MKKGITFVLISILFFGICIFFVSNIKKDTNNEGKIKIVATLFPQYDFAKKVGGDKVEVSLLLTPGTETHTYEPTPQDIIKVNNSNLFIYTGKYMEPWSDKIASSIDSETKILDVSKNIQLIKEEHSHDEGDDDISQHEEHEYDPHIWLNPDNAIIMVKNITEEFCNIDPQNADYYKYNSSEYIKEIQKLDSDISDVVKNGKTNKIAFGGTFSYSYFIEKYNLQYVSAYESCGEDTEPSVSKVKEVIDYMKNNGLKVIFYQELSSGKIAESIAKETGAEKLVFHTVHNASKEEIDRGESYISLMRKNLENLSVALQ